MNLGPTSTHLNLRFFHEQLGEAIFFCFLQYALITEHIKLTMQSD